MSETARHRSAREAPEGRGADAAERAALSAGLALQAAIIREQAALIARRDGALGRAATGLWACRLRDGACDWTGGVYDLFEIPRGSPIQRQRIVDQYEPASQRLLAAIRGRAIEAGGGFRLDAEIVTARGRRRWIRIVGAVEAEAGRPVRLHGTKQDITEAIARLGELGRRADSDPMTGLANRRVFEERLHGSGRPGALVLVDLDGFKQVNDRHGHAAGDLCIRRAALRLAALCRDAALVARIGGDEFAVILSAPVDPRGLAMLGRRIVAGLGRPIEHRGGPIRVGASVGIACACAAGPAALFERADAALYAAKAAGRNTVRIDGRSLPSGAGAA